MTNNDTTPTHEAWEDARQKRNEAATRVVWRAHGTTPGTGHPEDPDVAKYLAEFYRWDSEMDRIAAALDEAKAAAEVLAAERAEIKRLSDEREAELAGGDAKPV